MKATTEFRHRQYLFVYGTLMKGYGNNGMLATSIYEGPSRTLHSVYHMYECGFPIVSLTKDPRAGQIAGDLYLVTPENIEIIDNMEGHPYWYKRIRVPLIDGTLAWMYVQPEVDCVTCGYDLMETKGGVLSFKDADLRVVTKERDNVVTIN